jgi:hypothetical protein
MEFFKTGIFIFLMMCQHMCKGNDRGIIVLPLLYALLCFSSAS